MEEITKWIDVGSPVDIIYLDFQKAFDKVPHQRLLLKLKAHGIGDSITDWIEQWLTERRQRVVVDGEVSNWKSVLSGVPQGSVLGPILFLIYINDLDDNIKSNVLKFADDTKLFRKVNTDGDKQHLQNDLDRLVKFLQVFFTRFAIQAKGPDGKWTRKPLAYRESNNVHLLIARPPEICVNLVFKHIHAASSYTIC